MLAGHPAAKALQSTTASVFEILARTAKRGGDELQLETDAQSPVASDGDGAAAPSAASGPGSPRLNALEPAGRTIAGADGCKAGWIAAIRDPGEEPARWQSSPASRAWSTACPTTPSSPSTCRSACPISPQRRARPGDGWSARCSASGSRASSRSRRARPSMPSTSRSRRSSAGIEGHRLASEVAQANIRSAARRLDPGVRHLLRRSARSTRCCVARPDLRSRVIESHPEVAFWRLNGGAGDAPAEEGEGTGQSGRNGGAARTSRSPRPSRPSSSTGCRRAALLPTIFSTRRHCCSSPRATHAARPCRSPIRPASTATAFRWRSGHERAHSLTAPQHIDLGTPLCFSCRSMAHLPAKTA